MIAGHDISIAVEGDVAALVRLINSAYRGELSKKGWTTEANLLEGARTDEDSIRALLDKPGGLLLKYTDHDGTIIGCVYLQKQNGNLYLGMLTVSPELQARGIGKQLLAAATVHAEQQNCRSIKMNVISVRVELIAWYERHGYQRTGETVPFPVDPKFGVTRQPLEFVVLEKMITGKPENRL